jgi:uncharacterized membrane protein YphA (DoxX/SURF4 family)
MTPAHGERAGRGVSLLWHPAGAVVVRLLLGGVWLYAASHKVGHTGDFARMIYGYRVLHPELVNLAAITMPWMEVVTGALLVVGLLRRSAALVSCGLFAVFVVAIGLAMARGIDAPCGCFSVEPGTDPIGWVTLLRAGVLALLSAYLIFHPSRVAELDALWERPGR